MDDRSIGDELTRGWGGRPFDPEAPGHLIGGRYEVITLMGRGGMGAVYRCRDNKLDRDVAVKRLLAVGNSGEVGIARFRREGRTVASLNHRNIVVVHELDDDPGGSYLVMELLSGADLGSRYREHGALAGDRVHEVAEQVLAALSYAHKRSVIHRDIKPANLFELPDGTIKVVDFGLARIGTESQLSGEGFGLGTLDYVAPEQRRDASRVDHRADLFSLGATLYTLATGRSPRVVRERDLPQSLRAVVTRLLEDRPEERFFSAEEVTRALRGPTAPAAAHPATLPEGTCHECSHRNAVASRYCEGCGAGLFERCSNCDAEGRARRQFCGQCGTNIPDFKAAHEHAARAREHEEARRWSRAQKEWAAAAELVPDWDDAREGVARVGEFQGSLDALIGDAREALTSRELSVVFDAVARLEALCPDDDAGLVALRESADELQGLRAEADGLVADGEAVLALEQFEDAAAKAVEAATVWAGHHGAIELESIARAAQGRWMAMLEQLDVALQTGELTRADEVVGVLEATYPERVRRGAHVRGGLGRLREQGRRALALLTDLTTWDAASTEERRSAAEFIHLRNQSVSLVRLESHTCGGQTHEIAVFDHAEVGLEFVLIPAGEFRMGSTTGHYHEKPVRTVTLTRPFLVCRTMCTQAAWAKGGEITSPASEATLGLWSR